MKKITLLSMLFMIFFIKSYGQFGCGQGVVITNGFTQNAITTPGDGGEEDWSDLPVGTSINQSYWNDDVYLFQYTAGATDESVSMTTYSRSSWNGIGIFSSCTGNSFSGQLAAVGSTGANATKTVTATVAAGQTVYIATGQWGSPNNLDFDVVSFSANPIVLPPNCNAALTSPANNATAAPVNGILSWSVATGSPTGYKLRVGTSSGGIEVGEFVLGNITTYNIPGLLAGDTTYYVTIIPTNGNGDATACTEYSFTTGPTPIEGVICENAIIIDGLPYNIADNTSNYGDVYYEGIPGASGCGSTNSYLNGNDVVYSYTSTFSGTMKIQLTGAGAYTGFFIYGSCSDIGANCLNGRVSGFTAATLSIDEFPVEMGETYYIVISTWADPQTTAYTLDITENTCTNGAATYAVVSDCANGDQFNVNVNVTALGSATSMTISDNQGSAPQTVTAIGTFVFGPYTNTTPVIFTVNNDQDQSCFLTSASLTQAVCPPSNDTCAGAIDLTNETSPLMSTTVGATNTNLTVCNNSNEEVANTFSDVYYSILVPNGSMLTIGVTATNYDTANVVFYGDCDNRTSIACFDDPNLRQVQWPNTTGQDQTVYWVQDGWSGAGTFTLAWSVIACTPSQATYTVVSDCVNGEQFNVNVNVTNLGSATSVTVSDNQGSAPQTVAVTGIVSFGPYPNANPVIFTVVNDQDDNCTLTSPAMNQAVCPPVNDTCATAIDLTNETSPLTSTTVGATNTNLFVCNYEGAQIANVYGDVYYSIVVPDGSLLTIGQTENNYDSANIAFYGDCDNRTTIACFDDSDITQVVWANETGAEQTVYWVQDGWSGIGTFTLAWSVIACTPAQATYTVVSDCANGEQFNVNVNVTALGSATSVTVSDDQGSAPQTVSATGIVSFGPYANNNPVIFTVVNDQDDNCTLTSPAKNQVACPPSNDDCIGAIVIEVDSQFCDGSNNNGTNLAATDSGVEAAECFNYGMNDVWFSFVVPAGTATVDISTDFLGGTLVDTEIALYSGTCDSLVEEDCDQDGGTVILSNGSSYNSIISDAPVTVGETYFVRVSGYGSGSVGNFCLDVKTNETLSSNEFETAGFKLYPNPVKDVLNLSYVQNIASVEIFNMLGQQVLVKAVNATQGQVDMSNLGTGTYLVKIATDNQVKTIKVIKE